MAVVPPGAQAALPPEVWGVIARATLRAEGDNVHALMRLCSVNSTWRAALAGDHRSSEFLRLAPTVLRLRPCRVPT